ncbi:MAG: hypothetical protein ACYC96_08395 [Fimbriimonadaceae bacterium]
MKQIVKLVAPALCLAAIGCGGTKSASITFPYVRVFNAVDGQNPISLQFHDLSSNLLATSALVTLGTANPPSDVNFVYSLGTATILDHTGAPLYESASVQYAQNAKYTAVAAGSTSSYAVVVLTDNEGAGAGGTVALRFIDAAALANAGSPVDVYVLPAGATTIPGGTLPTIASLKFATTPTVANATRVDANGYLIMPDGGATTFSVIFTAAGTQTPLFPAQAITVADGAYYTDVLWDTGTTPIVGATLLADKR